MADIKPGSPTPNEPTPVTKPTPEKTPAPGPTKLPKALPNRSEERPSIPAPGRQK